MAATVDPRPPAPERRIPTYVPPLAAAVLGFLTALWSGYAFAPTGDDSRDYRRLALNVAAGHGLSLSEQEPYLPSAVRAPVYPLFLGLVYRTAGDSRESVLLSQALVLALGSALLARLALNVFNPRVALVTALLYGANPYFGRWAGAVLTEAVYLTLIIACVYCFTEAIQKSSRLWFALTGLAWAAATLCRPLTVALLPLMFLALLLSPRLGRRFQHLAILALFAVLGLLPWTVRNWLAFHSVIALQTQAFGTNVWIPTLPPEDQPTVSWEGIDQKWSKYPERETAVQPGKDTLAQQQAEKRLLTAAFRRIAADPSAYLSSRLRSWPRLWVHGGGVWYSTVSLKTALETGLYGVVFVKVLLFLLLSALPLTLGIIGIYLTRDDFWRVFPLLMVPLFIGLAHLPLWIEDRFGMPAVPFFLVFAAVTLTRLAPSVRS